MSFKLLAIRPLEGTDPKFLKNLRPNCIYKFYNVYHYLDKNGNRLDEYKDNQEFIDYSEVVNITKSETVPQNLYGENINISALVGQNGSGKSTLLELFYASLFSLNNKIDISIFLEVFIELDNNIYKTFFKEYTTQEDENTTFLWGVGEESFILKNNSFTKSVVKINKIFNNVINYSIYGLNENISGKWLGEIFRKNDAYKTPITINPYRENGNIDVNKEYLLAQQRMILNHYVIGNENILEGYKLADINYTIDIEKHQIISYKKTTIYRDKNLKSDTDINGENNSIKYIKTNLFIKNLSSILFKDTENKFENFVNLIFKSFNVKNNEIKNLIIKRIKNTKDDELFRKTSYEDLLHLNFLYIIKKLFKISDTYVKYRGYYNLMSIPLRETIKDYKSDSKNFESGKYTALELFEIFLNDLFQNQDHITFKLKQALKYFDTDIFNKIRKGNIFEIISDRKQKYIIENYINDKTKIEDIPLAMFDHEIIIDNNGKKIDFTSLSSGEQQKIHTILNVVYHAYNIISKNENESYKNMNLIFDEVELYFHPEFQRTFIKDLLVGLKFFKEKLRFNILFSTHSPFILSDIPSQNILKLEDGKPQPDKDGKNSFGANIHDLLADEFFLKKGFMGEFAKEYINFVYKEITELNDIDFKKYDELKSKIQIIGEPVLRNPILKLLDEKLSKHNEKNDLINYYKQLIQKLEE